MAANAWSVATATPTHIDPGRPSTSIRRFRMSRQIQAALAVILLPIAFFLLWYFPGYEGAIGCMVVILLSIFFYILSEKQPAA
jgi:hypothetical protein